ncbi:MAG: diacetylchitobiose deacetylase [Dehalococcoidia bacterium]|nr:MAG: diacetylchitobiose deacetylase [Dehalococcoidia bacterium]
MDSLVHIPDPVLVVCAHEDDIEIHAGGTIARLVQAGKQVSCVLATSGNRGTGDPAKTMEELAATREAEQREASAALGVEDLTFLRFDDGDLLYEGRRLREALIRCIRANRPRAIITHDPFPGNGSEDACSIYPDHVTVGYTAFQAAFVCAPGPLFHPEHLAEGLDPWKPEVLYCIMSSRPDFFVDIAPVWPQKWGAIRQHRSQGRHVLGMEQFFRNIARELGGRAGLELAEGFRVLLAT